MLDSTPVLEDTPSQTVDGTEEVTQEHNVQEQLAKYAEHQLAKEAEHGENLKAYYRKYPSRAKSSKENDAACPDAPSEEVCGLASAVKKNRWLLARGNKYSWRAPGVALVFFLARPTLSNHPLPVN